MADGAQEAEAAADARTRRRASRAAGPAGDAAAISADVVPTPPPSTAARSSTVGPPRRRAANTERVAVIATACALAAVVLMGCLLAILGVQHRHADAVATRDQRFVDAAAQTVVNMYSYTDKTVEESVDRFVAGTSGPLRDMIGPNADSLKQLYLATHIASSEAVINGAALEGIDEVSDNGSVLVAVRVTATDVDGVTKPSMPFRMRVIVHEDETGGMTAYDLKYPEGGN